MIEDFIVFICALSIFNLIRMTLYLVGSDIFTLRRDRFDSQKHTDFRPTVSLVVPAHNEQMVILQTLESLKAIKYSPSRLQIILADDGSTDDTAKIIKSFIRENKLKGRFEIYQQKNRGKADVLNNAIRRRARGSLVMCLDADSLIAPDGVKKAVQYFRDKRVVAMASNVNILENGSVLGLAQRVEYLVSYHMKKAQTLYNVEYIIGGIGSMFRRTMLGKVNYYDTNTMTEDIDLTMKIIATGNKVNRVVYAADCITYTEAVPTFKSLITQRYRWKYGRLQTFLKNYRVFFSRKDIYSKQLTMFILPYALVQEMLFILEPLIVALVIGSALYFRQPRMILVAIGVISSYLLVNLWSTKHLSFKEKVRLSFFTPPMYIILYMLSVAEYAALMKTIAGIPKLRDSISRKGTTWLSPERSGAAQKAGI